MRRSFLIATALLAVFSVAGAATCKSVKKFTWPDGTIKVGSEHSGTASLTQSLFVPPAGSCNWGSVPNELRNFDAHVFDVSNRKGQKAVVKWSATVDQATTSTPVLSGFFLTSNCTNASVFHGLRQNVSLTTSIPKTAKWFLVRIAGGTVRDVTVRVYSPAKNCPKKR